MIIFDLFCTSLNDIHKNKKIDTVEIIYLIEQARKVTQILDNEAQHKLIRKLISRIEAEDEHLK